MPAFVIPLISLLLTDAPSFIALIQQIVSVFNPSHPSAGTVASTAAATPSLPDVSSFFNIASMPAWIPAFITAIQNDAGPLIDGLLTLFTKSQTPASAAPAAPAAS